LLAGGGCQTDPYQIRVFGDGGERLDGQWPDQNLTDGAQKPADGTSDQAKGHDMSYDACKAIIEVCNGVDDNCDGQVDEGFDKQNDPRYCDSCKGCNALLAKHAYPGCAAGACVIASCMAGFVDQNNDPADGCEYECTPTGVEICDGLDNECKGKPCTKDADCSGGTCGPKGHCLDEGVTLAQNICKDIGPCQGAVAVCRGAAGWQCNYDPTKVELQPCTTDADCGPGNTCDTTKGVCPGVVVNDEKKCDGIDGDCDGLADDPWANDVLPNALGKPCDLDNPPKKGACRTMGKYICEPGGAQVTCSAMTCTQDSDCAVGSAGMKCQGTSCVGGTPSSEICNGIDDDCNGTPDDNVIDEKWIDIGGLKVFTYEASRPDGSATAEGAKSGRACSVPGRLPWSTVSRIEALAACQAAGARLCTPDEWKKACRGQGNTLYPYGGVFQPTTCNGRAFDPSTDKVLPTDQPGGTCVSQWPGGDIYNMSGNVKEWTAAGASYTIKGGAYDTPSIDTYGAGLSCDYDLPAPPDPPLPAPPLRLSTLGFRCCKL
jgi:hypothetical protein